MTNDHPELTITTEQLDALREAARARIDADFAGDRDAYFDQVGETGYILTATGWTTSSAIRFDPRCAITDRELLLDADGDHTRYGHVHRYVVDGGIWVSDYDESDEPYILPQVGTDPYDRTAPGPDADPVLVTASWFCGGYLLWPEAWWFDRRTAVHVATTQLTCGHQVDYQSPIAQANPELAIWQTADGYWVGELVDPEAVDEAYADEVTVWCVLDERYVAHALACAPEDTEITREGRRLPLVAFVLGLTRATEALILPKGPISGDLDRNGARPSTHASEQALDAVLATVTALARHR